MLFVVGFDCFEVVLFNVRSGIPFRVPGWMAIHLTVGG